MSKFNLKNYQKINGDEHITMRLKESHEEAPNVINEKQLESYRVGEENVTIEKLLEKNRSGADNEITEKRLDTHKAKFANKYRNPDAFNGDMNKLEEKRLTSDPVESEKYKPASETPSQLRWWEGVKSEDGLKVAKNTREAQYKVAPEVREEVEEKEGFGLSPVPETIEKSDDDFPVEDMENIDKTVVEEAENTNGNMDILIEKFLPNDNPRFSGVYMVLSYDPSDFAGDEEAIKSVALDTILSMHPELNELIGIDDLGDINDEEGTIKLKTFGEQFKSIVDASLKKK